MWGRNRTIIDVTPMREPRPEPKLEPFTINLSPLSKLGLVWTIFVAFFFLLFCAFNIHLFFSPGILDAIALIGGAPWALLTLIGWAIR